MRKIKKIEVQGLAIITFEKNKVCLLDVSKQGFYPQDDDFSENNLCVPIGLSPTIFFAECHAERITKKFDLERYQRFVIKESSILLTSIIVVLVVN